MSLLHMIARIFAIPLLALMLFGTSERNANAAIVAPWTISGPGSTSVDTFGNTTSFTYALNDAGFATQTWTATANVIESGLYQFDWNYSGLHAFFNVRAFLNSSNLANSLVDAGPSNCCTPPSNGFNFSGSDAFLVNAGQNISFTFGGSNSDIDNFLLGTLEISAVPLPPAFLMLLVALGMTAFIHHRGRRHMG